MAEAQDHHVREVGRQVEQLANITVQIGNRVENVAQRQQESETTLRRIEATLGEFMLRDRLDKSLQLATTRVIEVRQMLDTQYGHYGEVRRRATGIIQAFDAGLVTHDSVRSTTEDVMLKAPGYWLAPALVALAAWARDDKILADKAVKEALDRDPQKTALFLALILRRYGRLKGSGEWIDFLFDRQDPLALPRDFVIVLEGVAYGAFGAGAKEVASSRIGTWLGETVTGDAQTDAQVSRWVTALRALTPTGPLGRYQLLEQHAINWQTLDTSSRDVALNLRVQHHFEAIFGGELDAPAELSARIDGIIARLVTSFDEEELPLRREEARLQAIIDHHGDEGAAGATAAEAARALEDRSSIADLLTNASMRPGDSGASKGSQRLATALSRDWIVSAFDQIVAAARHARPASAEIVVYEWAGLIAHDGRTDGIEPAFEDAMDRKTEAQLAQVKWQGKHIGAGLAAVMFLILGFNGWFFLLIAAGIGFWLYKEYSGFDARRAAIAEEAQRRKEQGVEIIRGCGAEFRDYSDEWSKHDSHAEPVRSTLTRIDPKQFSMAGNRREVV